MGIEAMKKVRVEARNIGVSYGDTEVLRDVNLTVEPGEFFALLGPSGSGKSTLLRLIAGFSAAQRGTLRIDGRDVSRVPPWRRNVGMVFQNYALWPHMTVWGNVAFGLEERKVDRPTIAAKVAAVLELVGLSAYARRRPSQLSGGQQQRVALARTIVIEPQVLLLDEPLSNLDKKLRVQMRQELKSLQRTLGITTLFVTHDQEEAMTTADRMAVMDRGVVQQIGTPMALFDHPANRFVANFVGTVNTLVGKAERLNGSTVSFAAPGIGVLQLPLSLPHTGDVAIGFRPHTVRLDAAGAPRDGGHVWLDGVVLEREFLGEFVRYRVRVGDGVELIADRPHLAGVPAFAAGNAVCLGLEPSQIRCLRE
jgi:iron(III) transport system ATP-binding protein